MEPWWHLDAANIAKELGTDLSSGLSSAEAQVRLERYGRNQLKEVPKRPPWAIFFDQFKDFIIWVLIVRGTGQHPPPELTSLCPMKPAMWDESHTHIEPSVPSRVIGLVHAREITVQ